MRFQDSAEFQFGISPRTRRDYIKQIKRIERAFVFSSPMAQYVLDLPRLRSIVDFVDLDSAKWADYARRRPWPISAVYQREARRLRRLRDRRGDGDAAGDQPGLQFLQTRRSGRAGPRSAWTVLPAQTQFQQVAKHC